jgi:hypothetical protein
MLATLSAGSSQLSRIDDIHGADRSAKAVSVGSDPVDCASHLKRHDKRERRRPPVRRRSWMHASRPWTSLREGTGEPTRRGEWRQRRSPFGPASSPVHNDGWAPPLLPGVGNSLALLGPPFQRRQHAIGCQWSATDTDVSCIEDGVADRTYSGHGTHLARGVTRCVVRSSRPSCPRAAPRQSRRSTP